jgi:hypothetical protein
MVFRKIGLPAGSALAWAAVLLLLAGTTWPHDSRAATTVRSIPSVCAWEELSWAELTPPEQRLWARLGWSELNWDSDRYKPAASQSTDWAELTPRQRKAASRLGFNQANWDTDCR